MSTGVSKRFVPGTSCVYIKSRFICAGRGAGTAGKRQRARGSRGQGGGALCLRRHFLSGDGHLMPSGTGYKGGYGYWLPPYATAFRSVLRTTRTRFPRPGTKAGTGTAYHLMQLPTVGSYALLLPESAAAGGGRDLSVSPPVLEPFRTVDTRLHGKGNSNSHGARPVYSNHLDD